MSGRGGRGRHNSGGRDSGRGRSEGRGRGRGGPQGSQGGRGGGRGRGPTGGRDGGRGGRGEAPCPPVASSNVIPCNISPLQTFYVYGIDCRNANDKPIDSRSRRGTLFNLAIFGPNGLMERHYSKNPKVRDIKEEWRRILYFQNSVLFSPRPLPMVDVSQGPAILIGNDVKSDNGDILTLTDVTVYSPPVELVGIKPARAAPQASEITIDLRCRDCIKSFQDEKAMMLHCRELGHVPVTAGGKEETKVANREVFLQYANVILKRALGERLKPW